MKCVLLIEQHGQQNAVKVSIDESQSICIGRSWQSDVIVVDKYVDAQHLRISANEDKFLIEDLDSENGTQLKKKTVEGLIPYEFGTDITVGETTLRLLDASSDVAPAVKHDRAVRFIQKIGFLRSVILGTMLAILSTVAMVFGAFEEHTTLKDFLGGIGMVFGFMFVWTLLAGGARMIFRRKALFSLHWFFLCSMFALATVIQFAGNVVKFNLNSSFISSSLDTAMGIIAVLVLAYGTITLVSKLSTTKKLLVTGAIACLLVVSDVLMPMLTPEHERWSDSSTVAHTGQPPQFYFGKRSTVDSHMEKAENIFGKLEASVNWAEQQ